MEVYLIFLVRNNLYNYFVIPRADFTKYQLLLILSFGVLIETPAAALTAESLAEHCDFFAIGSNDLTMYTKFQNSLPHQMLQNKNKRHQLNKLNTNSIKKSDTAYLVIKIKHTTLSKTH